MLLAASWVVIVALFGLLGYLLSGFRLTLLCVVGLLLCGAFGFWEQSMQTLALMGISVLFSLVIGIPLGIVAASSDRFDRVLRPLLDGMQTMPAFVYLIPLLLFFGVGRVPAVIATMIYAIPPAIRLTNLGIRQVNPPAVEAARAFGSTRRQLLFKVQLPLALPTIMAGVNQTIMMALGMVVIAALIGAGGLGREVLVALDKLEVGQGLEAGLAIVFLAIILDRLSGALSAIDPQAPPRSPRQQLPTWLPQRLEPALLGVLAVVQRITQVPADALARLARSPDTRQTIKRRARLINSVLLIGLLFLAARLIGGDMGFPRGLAHPAAHPGRRAGRVDEGQPLPDRRSADRHRAVQRLPDDLPAEPHAHAAARHALLAGGGAGHGGVGLLGWRLAAGAAHRGRDAADRAAGHVGAQHGHL